MSTKDSSLHLTVPEIWDIVLKKLYNREQYVNGFIRLLRKLKLSELSLILDAGCGTGFPLIDLTKRGFQVVGIDASKEMLKQLINHAKEQHVAVRVFPYSYSELSRHFQSRFDFAYCRANSLAAASSWTKTRLRPSQTLQTIRLALKNFFVSLKPGGYLYVDISRQIENKEKWVKVVKPHTIETLTGPIRLRGTITYDWRKRTRTIRDVFEHAGKKKKFTSTSYLLTQRELIKLLRISGFKNIHPISVPGEKIYDVFLARK